MNNNDSRRSYRTNGQYTSRPFRSAQSNTYSQFNTNHNTRYDRHNEHAPIVDGREAFFKRKREDGYYPAQDTQADSNSLGPEASATGKVGHSDEPGDLAGDRDAGTFETPMLLFRGLDGLVTAKALYTQICELLDKNRMFANTAHCGGGDCAHVKRVFLARRKHTSSGVGSTAPGRAGPAQTETENVSAGFAFVELADLQIAKWVYEVLGKQRIRREPEVSGEGAGQPEWPFSKTRVSYMSLGSFQPASENGLLYGNIFKKATGGYMEYWNKSIVLEEYPLEGCEASQDKQQSKPVITDQIHSNSTIPDQTQLEITVQNQIHSKPMVQEQMRSKLTANIPKPDTQSLNPAPKFAMKLTGKPQTMKPISLIKKGNKPTIHSALTLDDDSWSSLEPETKNDEIEIPKAIKPVPSHKPAPKPQSSKKGWLSIGDKSRTTIVTNVVKDMEPIATSHEKVHSLKNANILSQLNKWTTKHKELVEDDTDMDLDASLKTEVCGRDMGSKTELRELDTTLKRESGELDDAQPNKREIPEIQENHVPAHNQASTDTDECLAAAEKLRLAIISQRQCHNQDKRPKSGETSTRKGKEGRRKSNETMGSFKNKKYGVDFSLSKEKYLENERAGGGSQRYKDYEETETTDQTVQENKDDANGHQELAERFSFGARMLREMGWTVNTGLGLNGLGIKEAIIPASGYSSCAGLGATEECIRQVEYEKSVERGNVKRKKIQGTLRERAMKRLHGEEEDDDEDG